MAQEQIYRSMKWNKEPRKEATLMWYINLFKGSKNIQWRKRVFSMSAADKTEQKHLKEGN